MIVMIISVDCFKYNDFFILCRTPIASVLLAGPSFADARVKGFNLDCIVCPQSFWTVKFL